MMVRWSGEVWVKFCNPRVFLQELDIDGLTTCHHHDVTGPGLAPGQLVPYGEGLEPEQVCPVSLSQAEVEAMYKHSRQVSHKI